MSELLTHNSFQDISAALSKLWDNANKQIATLISEKQALEHELTLVKNENIEMVAQMQEYKTQHDLMTRNLNRLQTEVDDFEDERKRFSRVSHVIAMEKENHRLKQDIELQERRVQIYQNQLKQYLQPQHAVWNNTIVPVTIIEETYVADESSQEDATVNDAHLQDEPNTIVNDVNIQDEPNAIVNDVHHDRVVKNTNIVVENEKQSDNDKEDKNDADESEDDEEGINVVEKKIKGVIYYLADNGDIYQKNEDESIGDLLGKLETSASGKTKVKWIK